jgi:Mce-associated membrane protein
MDSETKPVTALEPLTSARSAKVGPAKGKTAKKSKGKSAKKTATVTTADVDDRGGRQPGEPVGEKGPAPVEDEDSGQLTGVSAALAPAMEQPVPPTGEVPGPEAEAEEEPASPPSTTKPRMRSNRVLVGGGVLIVALAVALILSLLALGNQDAQASLRTTALTAARIDAVRLASYNYGDLKRGFATVAADSTPSFRRSFTESSDALKATLTQYKATADASVVSAGLVSSSPSRAVVLVFLTQKIANSTQPKPTTDRSQVQITLVRSGGRWLIDQVTLL